MVVKMARWSVDITRKHSERLGVRGAPNEQEAIENALNYSRSKLTSAPQ